MVHSLHMDISFFFFFSKKQWWADFSACVFITKVQHYSENILFAFLLFPKSVFFFSSPGTELFWISIKYLMLVSGFLHITSYSCSWYLTGKNTLYYLIILKYHYRVAYDLKIMDCHYVTSQMVQCSRLWVKRKLRGWAVLEMLPSKYTLSLNFQIQI